MKRSDLEKQFKQEAQEHTPRIYDKILSSARSEGLLPTEPQSAEIHSQGDTAVLSRSKKRNVGVITIVAAILACIAIILPFLLKFLNKSPVIPNGITLSANDVYGMGAVSTVRLLGANTSVQAIARLSSVRSAAAVSETETGTENEVKAQAQKFNEYFTALDSFMGKEIVTTVTETNTDPKYPYETKLTINSKNFNGVAVQHVMYFTETLNASGDDDDEKVYTLNGVLVADGTEYHLEGERVFEQEDDETENELKIRAYADLSDRTSYVEMEQEHSVENNETETEYVYSIVVNGVVVEQTSVEFETEKEGNKEEAEYTLEFRSGDAKGKYVVERVTENGKAQIKVAYDIDGKQGEFRISETANNGEYRYTFSDGAVVVF